ncbi:glycerophosphodiester phosphodiesterase [Fusibacter paucivorans]|uniref:Glycerophosphodiester phosphodiesterase n=1 Tax=Fusibacter paucivorans TaxID=76009 RepID=A0ABS5PPD2_9FIRM|nr:glycerophosphodiester phosphodiesterase family protein [Fusibacter paucivorans]MBS7526441.1 glycerophosphodiester phosphodiesterase [Fusibacter paucivorans]
MDTKVIAHRGAHEHYTENTLEAFELALEQGADGIELDVHFSKDGVLMVYHDFELSRLTPVKGLISDYTCDTLQSIMLWGHSKIPTLEEVLLLLYQYGKKRTSPLLLNVELKAGHRMYPSIETRVVTLCEQYLSREQIIYSSFDHHALVALKKIAPDIRTGALTASSLYEPWHYLKTLNADFFHPNIMTLDGGELKALQENGVAVNAYTVNDPKQAKQLIHAGVSGIITDRPQTMLALKTEEVSP